MKLALMRKEQRESNQMLLDSMARMEEVAAVQRKRLQKELKALVAKLQCRAAPRTRAVHAARAVHTVHAARAVHSVHSAHISRRRAPRVRGVQVPRRHRGHAGGGREGAARDGLRGERAAARAAQSHHSHGTRAPLPVHIRHHPHGARAAPGAHSVRGAPPTETAAAPACVLQVPPSLDLSPPLVLANDREDPLLHHPPPHARTTSPATDEAGSRLHRMSTADEPPPPRYAAPVKKA